MDDGLSRREFLVSVAGAGLVGGFDERILAALVGGRERVIFESGFEKGQPMVAAKQHRVVEGIARTGRRSMMGEVNGDRQACFLEVPFESKAGHVIHASCWVKSEKGSAAALFVRVGQKRVAMSRRVDKVPTNRWVRMEGRYEVPANCKGFVQFVAPSSHSAPAGKAWIDDVRVWETQSRVEWPGVVQDFGELAYDGKGRLWMASLERTTGCGRVRLDRIENGKRRQVQVPWMSIGSAGVTGVGRPAIAGLAEGCIVVRAFEEKDRWWIESRIEMEGAGRGGVINCVGTANVSPVVAVVGEWAFILWESNGGDARGIYALPTDVTGRGRDLGGIVRISSGESNSYNPAIVALEDGSLFAAWDSFRNGSADIYGAWYRNGRWEKERRITSDARIERHAALAVRDGEVWMAWQMQSYRGLRLNSLTEQRIAVARIEEDGLHAPLGLFDKVSTARRMLLRPRIAFDSSGKLLLTVRESLGQNSGWRPVVWSYSGREWSGPSVMMDHQGRWRPVSVCSSQKRTVGACQYDDLPAGWDSTRGKYRDWRSGLLIETFEKGGGEAVKLETEPLRSPETDFSLAERISMCAAELPRQKQRHGGEELNLYWGDFHDHTDISVCNRRGNPPGHDLFANVRDIERLDFCAMTDHGYNFDGPQWAFNGEQTRYNHDPGRFVAFLGEEWTSSRNPPAPGGKMNRYGHHNLIFLNPYHKKFYDSFDGDISPAELWKELEGTDFICIPHQLADWKGKGGGNPPKDWSFVDERLQPVAEIFQARQSYEYLGCPRQAREGAPFKGNYLQDAWAKGIIIGVIASPDHGGGSGKVGVWAKELTREGIFEAVRRRHTFGTSGAKMAVFFSAGEAMMGDKVQRPDGEIEFRVKAVAERAIKETVIFRNNKIVHRVEPGKEKIELRWTDKEPLDANLAWYYARIHAEDDELAWSSPIWLMG